MLQPLKEFICDTCGHVIKEISHAYVECKTHESDPPATYGFIIVHHKPESPLKNKEEGCYQYHDQTLSLEDFFGDNQMAELLSFLDTGPIIEPTYKGPNVKDLREYIEFFRRITIPYYEEARQYWSKAKGDGFFTGDNEIQIYSPSNLKRLIEKYS